ncbi:MAG: histidine phosphatase family protein [Pirellulales bacterium]|nr:histidine phosphatase family protein [Pirellulales bacterium]
MLQIALIRPGASDFAEQGRIQGTLDIPLNEHGREEVQREIDGLRQLNLDALYASDSEPAWSTAADIAKALKLRVKKLDNMHNLDHGLWQGLTVEEVRLKHPRVYRQWQDQPESVCPPSGEMLVDARRRVQAVLARLFKKHRQGVVGLVLPEPLASLVCSELRHAAVGDLWKAACAHGSFELIDIDLVQAS